MDWNYQVLSIGIQNYSLSELEKNWLREYNPGGVVLFNRNIHSPSQLSRLCAEIYHYSETPPLISIDQEGGLVSRLRPILKTVETETFAAYADSNQIFLYGELIGRMLSLLGISLNFAPVVDIKYSDADNALRTRYWGSDGKAVVDRAGEFLRGTQASGVLTCLKHFPGLGNTELDSHVAMPVNKSSLEELRKTELYPYSLLKDEADMVMISHCNYPAFGEGDSMPATKSRKCYQLLREEIQFQGVAITDDLGMGGIANAYDLDERIRGTLNAGADLLPFCNNPHDIQHCFTSLKKLIDNGAIDKDKQKRSLERIALLKRKIPREYSPPSNIEIKFRELQDEIKQLNLEVLRNG